MVKQNSIIDVQGLPDSRELAIDRVGIKDLRHPMIVTTRDHKTQHTIATCNLFADLHAEQKGTHMSRFVKIVNDFHEPLSVDTIFDLLNQIKKSLHSQDSYLELDFPYFCQKAAPISKVTSMMDYNVHIAAEMHSEEKHISLTVYVPVTSLCPCSKEISQYGAHNQRSQVTVTVFDAKEIWIEDLIELVERLSSCDLYGILKRADEKYVTERAYENPKFVEDIVRDIAAALHQDSRVEHFHVSAENFESIHNHSAYAEISH